MEGLLEWKQKLDREEAEIEAMEKQALALARRKDKEEKEKESLKVKDTDKSKVTKDKKDDEQQGVYTVKAFLALFSPLKVDLPEITWGALEDSVLNQLVFLLRLSELSILYESS